MLSAHLAGSRSDPPGRSDTELLRLTRERADVDAFGEFYRRHQGALAEFFIRQTADGELAQDLVAESFAIAFSKVDRFDPGRGEARQWLFGIARIALLARRREGGADRAIQARLEGAALNGEHLLDAVEARLDSAASTVVAGLGQLSAPEREAVVSRVVEEREYVEIAHRQSTSEVAVRQRVSRGLRKLARLVGRERG